MFDKVAHLLVAASSFPHHVPGDCVERCQGVDSFYAEDAREEVVVASAGGGDG